MKKTQQQPNMPQTAEEYYRRAEQHRTAVRQLWGDFVVSFFVAAAALIVLVFFTIAWFVSNTRVTGTTASVSARDERYLFTISTAQSTNAQQGAYESAAQAAVGSGSLDISDAMQVNAQYDFLNLTDSAGQLSPGSSGKLQFTVTPQAEDLGDITIELQRNLITRGEDAAGNSQAQSVIAQDTQNGAALYRYAQGHILFFLQQDENGYYSDWLPTNSDKSHSYDGDKITVSGNTITISRTAFCAAGSDKTTQPYTFTLYWVWPEVLRNVIFTGSGNLFLDTKTNAYTQLLGDINHQESESNTFDRRNKYFSFGEGDAQAEIEPDAMTSQAYLEYSKQYNQADEAIGYGLEYMQIRLVSSENASGSGQESEEGSA